MYIITNKDGNEIIGYGETDDLAYQEETNYPMFVSQNIAFPAPYVNILEASEIPEEVLTNGVGNYCYTVEDQFYWNPNIEIPDEGNTYGISNDIYRAIKEQAITEVQNELNQ